MNLSEFLKLREQRENDRPKLREICPRCFQPGFSCFCAFVKPISPEIEFVILTHPIEVKHRRIASGRLAHLILKNSRWLMGHDFSMNEEVNVLVSDPRRHCVTMYPGPGSVNLTHLKPEKRFDLFPEGKTPTVFVVDGTWATARKMVRLSRNINSLPRICFTPSRPSEFRVRQQPNENCYSTVEAIHETLDLFGAEGHEHLLYVFDKLVNRQLELAHSCDAMAREFKP
jgi:DTW domain-containing protein YfiP